MSMSNSLSPKQHSPRGNSPIFALNSVTSSPNAIQEIKREESDKKIVEALKHDAGEFNLTTSEKMRPAKKEH